MSVTWNPADKDSGTVLSNGNLTATTTTGNDSGVRATLSHTTNKWYIEFDGIGTGTGGFGLRYALGFATSAQALDTSTLTTGFGIGTVGQGEGIGVFTSTPGINLNGHNLGFAIDIDTGLFWFRYDGTAWIGANNISPPDPVAEVVGVDFTTAVPADSTLFPFVLMLDFGAPATATILPGVATQLYPPPMGYTPWDGTVPANLKRSFATVMS